MPEAFLNVEKSLTDRCWLGPSSSEDRKANSLAQALDISVVTGLLLSKHDLKFEEIGSFLEPKIRDMMPEPYCLIDMEKAANILFKAIVNKDRIGIFSDYDVDGTSSAAILTDWLKEFGISSLLYIPDRVIEGYGPNIPAMVQLSKDTDLIICLDCGTLSFDPIKRATETGCKVIVVDHHQSGKNIPNANALVNPNQVGESSGCYYLCAAGVLFLLLVATNRLLKTKKIPTPNLIEYLDLVALATIADVVPLVGLNRALVKQGLKIMAKRNRIGLVALGEIAGIRSFPTTFHVSFLIAPRINACGRMRDAKLAVDLLTTTSYTDAKKIAFELDELNSVRQLTESSALNEAINQIEGKENKSLIWAVGYQWHPGILGIVAARLKDKFNLPAIVISINKSGVGTGSARSIPDIDMGLHVRSLAEEGYIEKGGGHKMAAGLTIQENKIKQTMQKLKKLISKELDGRKTDNFLLIDSMTTIKGASLDLITEMEKVGPFGSGNPNPRIVVTNCRISFVKTLKNKHIKFTLKDSDNDQLEAIFFNSLDSKAGSILTKSKNEKFHFCGRLEINDWGGRLRPVLHIEDVAKS